MVGTEKAWMNRGSAPPHERGGEGHIRVVAHVRRGGHLLTARDDNALVRLLDHVQREVFFLHLPRFVLRLLTPVDLRVAEGVRQEDVVLLAESVVVHHILAEVAVRVLDRTQRLPVVIEAEHELRQQVRPSTELAPCLLVPDLAVASLSPQVLVRPGQQVGQAATDAAVRRHEGHLVAVLVSVLKLVDAGQLVDGVLERGVRRDVRHLFPVDPHLTPIAETLLEAFGGMRAVGFCRFGYHGSPPLARPSRGPDGIRSETALGCVAYADTRGPSSAPMPARALAHVDTP